MTTTEDCEVEMRGREMVTMQYELCRCGFLAVSAGTLEVLLITYGTFKLRYLHSALLSTHYATSHTFESL